MAAIAMQPEEVSECALADSRPCYACWNTYRTRDRMGPSASILGLFDDVQRHRGCISMKLAVSQRLAREISKYADSHSLPLHVSSSIALQFYDYGNLAIWGWAVTSPQGLELVSIVYVRMLHETR